MGKMNPPLLIWHSMFTLRNRWFLDQRENLQRATNMFRRALQAQVDRHLFEVSSQHLSGAAFPSSQYRQGKDNMEVSNTSELAFVASWRRNRLFRNDWGSSGKKGWFTSRYNNDATTCQASGKTCTCSLCFFEIIWRHLFCLQHWDVKNTEKVPEKTFDYGELDARTGTTDDAIAQQWVSPSLIYLLISPSLMWNC